MQSRRRIKNAAKRNLRRIFELGQRVGVDILPRHFYSEVPDLRRQRADPSWKAPRSLYGVNGVDPDRQLGFVEACCTDEMRSLMVAEDLHAAACRDNGSDGFGRIESDFLYAFIRARRPPRIVQVGCGVSTAVILRALEDGDVRASVTCIDPYPNPYLRSLARSGEIELVERGAERVDVRTLSDVGPDGLLFVDSSHAVVPGGEVNQIVLEVLSRLPHGSFAHFHDINFPYEYGRDHLDDALFFSRESVLLHAFLIGNPRVSICTALSMLHYARPDELRELLPNYRPAANDAGLAAGPGHFPSSLYLRVREQT